MGKKEVKKGKEEKRGTDDGWEEGGRASQKGSEAGGVGAEPQDRTEEVQRESGEQLAGSGRLQAGTGCKGWGGLEAQKLGAWGKPGEARGQPKGERSRLY